MSRTFRVLAVVASAAMIMGALVAGPAEAKKKKKKKAPAPPVCATYVPGELGAEAETSIVTDEATEEAPVEVELDTEPGLGFSSTDPGGGTGHVTHVYHNVQVDSSTAETGLYVRLEFLEGTEYDLFLRYPDGSTDAYVAGFNQAPMPAGDPTGFGLDGTGHGGHSEFGAEQLDGIRSADCAGYTIDVASAGGPGGPVTLKMWLGEATYP